MLGQWLTSFSLSSQRNQVDRIASTITLPLNVSEQLPQIDLINHASIYNEQWFSTE